jgi:Alr-MurF fusion protein
MKYTVKDISSIISGTLFGEGNRDALILHLLIDSRRITHAETSLFFAIKGERHDGHKFIYDLYEKGVRNFVVSKLPEEEGKVNGAGFILVKDTLKALQELCAAHRKRFSIPVIGITGSNGKTIVKEWLYQLLREDKNIVRSPKSFNSQVGVPLSVWQMGAEHEIGIFEAGISQPGEMNRLEKIMQPTIGIFTNVGQAHDENFRSQEQKVEEKLDLFVNTGTVVYCRDYLLLHEKINSSKTLKEVKAFTWSKKTRADLQIQAVHKNDFLKIKIPFTDEASVENAIHCWAALLLLGYDNAVIAPRMALLSPVAMRLEMKEGVNNCSVINDSYNSDLGSLSIALDFLNQQKQHPRRTLILSDILQSGRDEPALYREVAELLHKKGVNRLIGIGEAITRQSAQFKVQKEFYPSTSEFLAQYTTGTFRDETILLKGARTFGFEDISKVLQQKAHETVLEVNLNALVHNLNYFRSRLKPGTKMMAMVKAFSYGSGSYEIASALQFHHVDYLAVAYADEGIELRKAGLTLPVMVMNPEEQSYDSMIQYNLEPEIYSFRVLGLFDEAARRSKKLLEGNLPSGGQGKKLNVHIKLDTGMHRLGFEEKDLNELMVRIRNNKFLTIRSVFSHLAGSDEPEHDEFTRSQITRFGEMSAKIISHFDYPILRHILNSAGITRFTDAQFDMVRLGIGMYGIGASAADQAQLENVHTLKTTISQIKQVPKGESIGYSRKFVAPHNMQIATVPIGYADGLNRKLGNGTGKMFVHGKPAPIVGNVCMDMCMIDITRVPAAEGDEVIVFGNIYPITELAKDLGTIPYEALTSVSGRVKRVYFQE